MQYNNSSMRDYGSGWSNGRSRGYRGRGLRWAVIGVVSGLCFGLLGINSYDANAIRINELTLEVPSINITPELLSSAVSTKTRPSALPEPVSITDKPAIVDKPEGEAEHDIADSWHKVTVKSGDSLAKIFSRLGIPPRQLHDIVAQGGVAKKLTRIYPGQTLQFRTSEDDGLLELLYEIDDLNKVRVVRNESGFALGLTARKPERRTISASGTIENSLFVAAQRAKLPGNITMELAGIFGWDIDFALDIRRGDEFSVLYEDLYLDGERIGTGNILAAEFTNNGKMFQAVRYTDAKNHTDYYDASGHSMRKTFLRTPVSFSRISSRFSLGRKHPILNRIRAHKGVDYAASRGTPVKATGAGKIVLRGKKGGYGNTVVIQHGSTYSTLYAHLSSYARGQKTGSRVRQGQVIGYVGSSGLATGPHLHYEFRVSGTHRNPLTVRLPNAAPLAKAYQDDFSKASQSLLSQLELSTSQAVALQND